MSAQLDFPPIDQTVVKPYPAPATQQPAPTTAVATLTSTALAPLLAIEQDLRALADRYRDVAFDLKTPKGLAAMKAARHDLRENGRYLVNRAVTKCKDEANAAKKAVELEAVRLVAITEPRETEFDEAIVARENEIAAEKAERDRIEAERVAKHMAGIDTIRGYVGQCEGKSADQIARAIEFVTVQIKIGESWQEFQDEAEAAKTQTLARMLERLTLTRQREAEAARIEAQRIENARVAAEQAERQRKLDEQAAAIQRQADELAAERAAATLAQSAAAAAATVAQMAAAPIVLAATPNPLIERHVVITDEGELAAPNTPAPGSQHVLKAEAATPDATDSDAPAIPSPVGGPMGAEQPAAAGLVGEALSLTIGKVCARLGFIVSAEFLGTLGFTAKAERSSRLFREQDFPAMCAKLAEHVLRVGEEHSK